MSLPDLPRDRWERHPRYPSQTLLLGSHEGFRRMSAWVLKAVGELVPGDPSSEKKRRRWLRRYRDEFDWWMTGMKGHERYEERKLYPYLARRYDTLFAHLQRGHLHLDERRQRVQRAFRAVTPGGADEAQAMEELTAALVGHRGLLIDHLREEEDLIIPMLLDLTPDEFRALTTEPIESLLARTR